MTSQADNRELFQRLTCPRRNQTQRDDVDDLLDYLVAELRGHDFQDLRARNRAIWAAVNRQTYDDAVAMQAAADHLAWLQQQREAWRKFEAMHPPAKAGRQVKVT